MITIKTIMHGTLKLQGEPFISFEVSALRNNRWKLRCPFHSEDTESFLLDVHGDYHCLGCGKKGIVDEYHVPLNNGVLSFQRLEESK